MAYRIEDKLVIGVASSALFELDEADEIFRRDGLAAYRAYQLEHQRDILKKGVAFPFVKRLLALNKVYPDIQPVDVVLLSHNDPDTGLRVFNSIQHYKLDIVRAAFTTGDSPFQYIPAYNVSLFLSANEADVKRANAEGYAAGQVLKSTAEDEEGDDELRIAFDFDGVIADDSAESVYKNSGIDQFYAQEKAKAAIPHSPGPLADLFSKLAKLHKLEDEMIAANPLLPPPSEDLDCHGTERAPRTNGWSQPSGRGNITVDQTFLLGGMDKGRILAILKPHIFFDDQVDPHLTSASQFTPSVYIPIGGNWSIPEKKAEKKTE